jgi:hypothetical protein
MSGQTLQVVQFVHPGFEYQSARYVGGRKKRSGVMEWKHGGSRHDRKFMLSLGSLVDLDTGRDHRSSALGFWGEWEGPSVFWKLEESPGRPLPKIVHAPFRPTIWPTRPVQNTDPMVFGDAFIYSNCLQPAYRSLRTLTPGSIILFGRHARARGQPSFSLDTCLVIDRVETLAPVPALLDTIGTDLLAEMVLIPLHSEGAQCNLTVYSGKRRTPASTDPFSFFPARMMIETPPLFARPALTPIGALAGVINPGKMQGIKLTSDLSFTDRDAIWTEVVQQVTGQGCGLGYRAWPPSALESHRAESAAGHPPAPLSQ